MELSGETDREAVPGAIFHQPWWLEAVAPAAWGAVTIARNGTVAARLPYVTIRRRGRKYLTMPPLTPFLGPWLSLLPGKNPSKSSAEKEVMTELIDRLPAFDAFKQHLHPSVSNWLPFYWRGFEQTTRYTHILAPLSDLGAIWDGLASNLRRNIRKAQALLAVRDDLGLDAFLDLDEKTFRRQGLPLPYGRDLVARIDEACTKRTCRRILFAEDAQGRLHAASYFVWDSQSAYYLMSGGDPELRNSGAASLLMWEGIQFAATVTHSFNLAGSMIEPINRFFRSFGAVQTPYLRITKTNSLLLKMYDDIRDWRQRWKTRRSQPSSSTDPDL